MFVWHTCRVNSFHRRPVHRLRWVSVRCARGVNVSQVTCGVISRKCNFKCDPKTVKKYIFKPEGFKYCSRQRKPPVRRARFGRAALCDFMRRPSRSAQSRFTLTAEHTSRTETHAWPE